MCIIIFDVFHANLVGFGPIMVEEAHLIKRKNRRAFLILLLTFAMGLANTAATAQISQEKKERLLQGAILTEGGKGVGTVWARVDAVVWNRPLLLWQIFLATNEWTNYQFPRLKQSRAVSEDQVQFIIERKLKSRAKIEKFLRASPTDDLLDRRKGGIWVSYQYQVMTFPPPVGYRWVIVKYVHDETASEKDVYRSSWSRLAGSVRFFDGSVLLQAFDSHPFRSHVALKGELDIGVKLPDFILSRGIKKSLPKLLGRIRNIAAQRELPSGGPESLVPYPHPQLIRTKPE